MVSYCFALLFLLDHHCPFSSNKTSKACSLLRKANQSQPGRPGKAESIRSRGKKSLLLIIILIAVVNYYKDGAKNEASEGEPSNQRQRHQDETDG